jgi:hypothetical protein
MQELTMDLANVVGRLSEEAAQSTSSPDIREAIRRTGGVPVYADMGGVLLITREGDVWQYDHESVAVGVELEERWRQLALARAARHFPDLRGLAPQRPAGAIDCPSCGGAGVIMETLDCGVCSSTGWISPAEG